MIQKPTSDSTTITSNNNHNTDNTNFTLTLLLPRKVVSSCAVRVVVAIPRPTWNLLSPTMALHSVLLPLPDLPITRIWHSPSVP